MAIVFVGVGGLLVWAFMSGKLDGANTQDPGQLAQQGKQAAQDAGSAIYAQPWFWEAVVAGAAALGIKILWKRAHPTIRGTLIAAVTVAVTLLVVGVVGHR